MQQHCATLGRSVHVVNLDPAADEILYSPSVDIRELISVDDVMEELDLGPNGGLVYCMELVSFPPPSFQTIFFTILSHFWVNILTNSKIYFFLFFFLNFNIFI